MSRHNTPQENKLLDYLHQSKNQYGENDKSSRKAIRHRKAQVNRQFRRAQKSLINQGKTAEDIDTALSQQPRLNWQKYADAPLIERITQAKNDKPLSQLQQQALVRLQQQKRRHRS